MKSYLNTYHKTHVKRPRSSPPFHVSVYKTSQRCTSVTQLILVAVETKQSEHTNVDGESTVIVNPASDFRISKGDRGFLLAESQVC